MARIALLLIALLSLPPAARCHEPVRLIFDTDMGNDVDDALALALIHSLQSRGEVRLLAVTVTKDNPWAAAYIDAVNTFYGRPDIPIGVVRNGKEPGDGKFNRQVADRRKPDGTHVYPHDLTDGRKAPEAVGLLRRILAKEADQSVVIVQVGFSTNLVRLLDSAPDEVSPLSGKELAARKVKLLSVMAGWFPDGKPEYNVRVDIPSARKLFGQWPTPIVFSGFEIGQAIRYSASSIERDYAYVVDHPVAEAYRLYDKMPHDRPTWDLTSVFYLVRPDYFGLSDPGTVEVDDEGRTRLKPSPSGRHRYLTVTPEQASRIKEAFLWLCSEPPKTGTARN